MQLPGVSNNELMATLTGTIPRSEADLLRNLVTRQKSEVPNPEYVFTRDVRLAMACSFQNGTVVDFLRVIFAVDRSERRRGNYDVFTSNMSRLDFLSQSLPIVAQSLASPELTLRTAAVTMSAEIWAEQRQSNLQRGVSLTTLKQLNKEIDDMLKIEIADPNTVMRMQTVVAVDNKVHERMLEAGQTLLQVQELQESNKKRFDKLGEREKRVVGMATAAADRFEHHGNVIRQCVGFGDNNPQRNWQELQAPRTDHFTLWDGSVGAARKEAAKDTAEVPSSAPPTSSQSPYQPGGS
ncbi:hypothetical protein KVT40_002095 [Elsinoe batatas]|uniref:Uncharacterized protein n=1 Tax=Elsinoe batatas TaxID=2601811 RepID=A0A8K0L5V0_9PEZI|nr:hypothetical protein KVT40_002095 [Elsinoe batatas]